jgi:surface protein
MYKYFLVLLFVCVWYVPSAAAQTPGAFVTTWDTTNAGSAPDTIVIPTTGAGYDFEVNWGDGSTSTHSGTAPVVTHTYDTPGIKTIEITGDFPRIFFNNTGDRAKILTVEQWGNIAWSSMLGAFHGANNLQIPATDAPDLRTVTSLENMFRETESMNSNINHWDVSNVTSIRHIFSDARSFNQPLDNWDVSNVSDFRSLFRGASAFNQDISGWDTSSGTNFASVFLSNTVFNQPINTWDLSSATNLGSMFRLNRGFNQSIADWNIINVTNINNMFVGSVYNSDNYSDLLVGWASLPSLQSGLNLSLGGTKYQSYASTSRQLLIDTYGWNISDGGLLVQYTLAYDPGANATLLGPATQLVIENIDATTVEVVPNDGFEFVQWSDGVLDNPRTDLAVQANISVSAQVEPVVQVESSQPARSSATNPAVRQNKVTSEAVSSTTTESSFQRERTAIAAAVLLEAAPELFADHDFDQPITDPDKMQVVIQELLRLITELLHTTQDLLLSDGYWEMA